MFSKLWFINIALAAGVVFFAVKTHDVWFKQQKQYSEPAVSATRQETQQERQFTMPNLPPESSYRSIVDKNLFSEDRAEYLPPTPDPELELSMENETEVKPFEGFGKNVILYGVFIWEDNKKALITNPDPKQGGPKDIWVERGDVLLEVRKHNKVATLKVDDILTDRILVKDETDKYEILLYDKNNPRERETIKMDEVAEVIAPDESGVEPEGEPDAEPDEPKTPFNQIQKAIENKRKNAKKPESAEEPEYEIVNTPFGEIKRRIN